MKTRSILFFNCMFFAVICFSQAIQTVDTTYYNNKRHHNNTDYEDTDSLIKRIKSINFKSNGLLTKKIIFLHDGKTKSSEVNYVGGSSNSKITSYYKNGDTSSVSEYSDDLLNKKITYSYNNKKASLVTYKEGKKHGPTILYYENGNIKYTCTYHDDKMYGVRMCYDPGGNVSEGHFIFYNADGTKEREGTCINGKPEGNLVVYNGKNLVMLLQFKDGKPHGKVYYYDRYQNVTSTEEYYEGVFIEVIKPITVQQ